MVEIIRLQKGFPYSADFRERIRQFNHSLVADNAEFVADLLQTVPGMKITRFSSDKPTDEESQCYDALIAERDAMHDNATTLAA